MQLLVVLSAVAAVAVARPGILYGGVVPLQAAVSSQYHAQDELGQYAYGYSSPLSAKSEIRGIDGSVAGGYDYVDANGLLQSVRYASDAASGFRVAATNLPVAPVPEPAPSAEAPKPVEDTPEVAAAKEAHASAVVEAEKLAAAPEPEEKAAAPATALLSARGLVSVGIPRSFAYTAVSTAPVLTAAHVPLFAAPTPLLAAPGPVVAAAPAIAKKVLLL